MRSIFVSFFLVMISSHHFWLLRNSSRVCNLLMKSHFMKLLSATSSSFVLMLILRPELKTSSLASCSSKSCIILSKRRALAAFKALPQRPPCALTSVPCSSNNCTIAFWLYQAAACSAFPYFPPCALTSAPCSSNNCTMALFPSAAMRWTNSR